MACGIVKVKLCFFCLVTKLLPPHIRHYYDVLSFDGNEGSEPKNKCKNKRTHFWNVEFFFQKDDEDEQILSEMIDEVLNPRPDAMQPERFNMSLVHDSDAGTAAAPDPRRFGERDYQCKFEYFL